MKNGIREFERNDWDEVRRIFDLWIEKGTATFETCCPDFEEWDKTHMQDCRYVCLQNEKVVGFLALSPISDRCVYGGVAEISVYIDPSAQRTGAGTALLNCVLSEARAKGIWTLQAGIIQDNMASIALHKKCGFREIGYREKIGRDKFGVWKNTVLMEHRDESDCFGCV